MQVAYHWLKEYLDFSYTPAELAEKMTMAGLEVEGIEYLGEGINEIVIGEIVKIEEHQDADKLVICQVKIDDESELLQIVTGAPNVVEGERVPIAKVGTTLPGGMKIKKAKLRGVNSFGMMCSTDELGLSEERAHGIMLLGKEAPVGRKLTEYLGLDEYVLKLDLTPNYARCLGMLGVAREIKSLYTGGKVNYPEVNLEEDKNEAAVDEQAAIEIKADDLCPRYTGRLIKNIKVGPSPKWMQQRLRAAGIRPINNIVDITNYVLMEYNQPLHAFDYDKLNESKIIVRRAVAGEKIVTLDEKTRELTEEMLVIADAKEPVAVAGVMGGANSEVTDDTVNIFLESAYFNPVSIRKTARQLGLPSEASHRFERGVDIGMLKEASDRACQLMVKYADGELVPGIIDEYPGKQAKMVIKLDPARVNELLGLDLSTNKIAEMLASLDFEINKSGNLLEVAVPTFRGDVTQSADLVEEVARVYGYNNIPTTRPISKQLGSKNKKQKFEDLVHFLMRSAGLDQVITYSLQDKKIYQGLKLSQGHRLLEHVELKNPLSAAFGIMRTSLLPGIIDVLASNARRQIENMHVFEMGKIFFANQGQRPTEINMLSGGTFGAGEDLWQTDAPNFFFLKGALEMLFTRLQIPDVQFKAITDEPYFHPGRAAKIVYKGQYLGQIGELLPAIIDDKDLQSGTTVFELNLDKVRKFAPEVNYKYEKLPHFPAVSRDLAVVIKNNIPVADIFALIEDVAGELLKELQIFDIYQGDQIRSGFKSVAFKLKFQSPTKTLEDKEVNKVFKKIISQLSEKFSAEVRGN